MSIRTEEYTEEDFNRWDTFIDNSWNGTLFHKRKFLSYHPDNKFEDRSLIVKRGKKWLAIIPAATINGEFISHPGSSYGGIILKGPLSIKKTHTIVECILDYFRDKKIEKVKFTLTPTIYHKLPCDYLNFVLFRNNFKYERRELSAYIPASVEPFDYYKQSARTSTRKARKKGVQIRESEDYEKFYKILQKNLKMRHNTTPTHTLKELIKIKKLFPEDIRLFSAFYSGKMIAGVVLFNANEKVTLAFYISHREDYQHLRPVNLLFYEILKWANSEGFDFLDLGTFTLNMEPNFGLGRFKESLGAQGIFRDYLYLNIK